VSLGSADAVLPQRRRVGLVAEIFPLHMRGLGIGIAVFFGWATNGFLALFFPALVEAIHINGVFFRFPGCLGGAAQCAGPSLPGVVPGAMRDGTWATSGPGSPPQRATPPQIPATSAEVGA
jgi:hypothetical protein